MESNNSNPEQAKATPAVIQAIALTVEEVQDVENTLEDNSSAGVYQATLEARGTEVQPDSLLDEDFFYNWKRQVTLTPIGRAKVLPKLHKMGVPMVILNSGPAPS